MPDNTKKWELFPGRNKFCLDGRIMMAPDVNVFFINVFLIVGTTLLFVIFDCPYLTLNLSPLIPVVTVILFIFVMCTLLKTSFTDPGIIPRATQDEAMYIEKQIKMQNGGEIQTDRPPPRTKEVNIRGQTVKLKYCFTCRIFRPPRASHCSLCDNCVEHFDHHCPWVGNCVGRRNYRYFYMFIISLSVYIIFVFVCTCSHLYLLSENRILLDAISDSPSSLIVLLVTFFSCWSVFGLAGFHTYLTASNKTTNEDIKGSFTNKRGGLNKNPYSRGNCCANCCYVLCGPVPSSLLDRRGVVTSELGFEKSIRNKEQKVRIQDIATYSNLTINKNSNNHLPHYQPSPLFPHRNGGLTTVSNPEIDKQLRNIPLYNRGSNITNPYLLTPPRRSPFSSANELTSSSRLKTQISVKNPSCDRFGYRISSSSSSSPGPSPNKRKTGDSIVDVSKIELDLDDVVPKIEQKSKMDKTHSLSLIPLSASRLQLLQDTTMIESALDLDSLEESTSSAGTGSQVGLVRKKGSV